MTVDRIRMTSGTNGTGPLTMLAVGGFRSFGDEFAFGGSDAIDYVIEGRNSDGSFDEQYEIGVGSLNGGGQLVRSSVLYSSSGAVPHNFTSSFLVVTYGLTRAAIQRIIELTTNPMNAMLLAHATRHIHGGADEIATATPTANGIPKASDGVALAGKWAPRYLRDGTISPINSHGIPAASLNGPHNITAYAFDTTTPMVVFFEAYDDITINEAAFEVTVAATAGATMEIAIFNAIRGDTVVDAGAGFLGTTLVSNFGTVSIDTIGAKIISGLSAPLVRGKAYALVYRMSAMPCTIKAFGYSENSVRMLAASAATLKFRRLNYMRMAPNQTTFPTDLTGHTGYYSDVTSSSTPYHYFPVTLKW